MKQFRLLKINEDGAAAVEFAIVLPIFLILVFGIIEFGIIMYNKALITNASREGARFGILYNDDKDLTDLDDFTKLKDEITDTVESKLGVDSVDSNKSRLISLGGSAEPKLIPEPSITTNDPDDYLVVTVTYLYDFLLVPSFIPGLPEKLNISATTSMRLEKQIP